MRATPRAIVLVAILVLAGSVDAEHSDGMGVGIASDRAGAMAYLAEQHERRARSEALHVLRRSLRRFDDVAAARGAGYAPDGVCIAGADGALGVPFVRAHRPVAPPATALAPQALSYATHDDGSLRLVGAQYAVLRDAWHADGRSDRPAFLGEPYVLVDHLFDEPAYVLFVWLDWPNPAGEFAAWHPAIRCDEIALDDADGPPRHPPAR